MKHFISFLLIVSMVSCQQEIPVNEPAIIPLPVSLKQNPGSFSLNKNTRIVASAESMPAAEFLRDFIQKGTGLELKISEKEKSNAIIFSLVEPGKDSVSDPEGYSLISTSKKVRITAISPAGLLYGAQTLRQLFPPEIEGAGPHPEIQWAVPLVEIYDQPAFRWRGMMLDCVRHFFPVSHVKHLLDQIAALKMNHFHWHLVDDQGWRIEILKYPELTKTSAWRVDREDLPWGERPSQKAGEEATYGGFYTQDEIREVVAYAAKLNIEIIPEIEMPAHVSCVFASYPELSCTGKKITVPPGGVWPITDIYCAGNDSVFAFLENVLSEVAGLFPSKYIHVGGDEATKTEWKKCPKCQARIKKEGLKNEQELQSYFMSRIEKFLNSKGKNLIGWDEILEGGLAPQATVMSWRGFEGGIEAAGAGHDVVMSPTSYCYFDYYQGPKESEPLAIGGFLPLSKVYQFNPVPAELKAENIKHILGGQANLWTEFIPTPEHSEYMLFPRLDAMAEDLWTPLKNKNYDDFLKRLQIQFERYDFAGVNYSKNIY
ncbi:MAG: beta-N-acetylhexosaminidase [Bacteroidales bacterium]|nr:beta-N-acetylhexosaminidase [Bacteroidales bacterium]